MRRHLTLLGLPALLALGGCAGALPDCNDAAVRGQRQQHLRALLLEGDADKSFWVVPTVELVSSLDRRDRIRYCRAEMTYGVAPETGTSVQTATVRIDFQLRTNELDGSHAVVMEVGEIEPLRRLHVLARQLKQEGGKPPAPAPAPAAEAAEPAPAATDI